jgi:sporulation protein YtfJ
MDNHDITSVMNATMGKIKELVDTNTVIGKPITTADGIMLIPLSKVSFGFASGGSEFAASKDRPGMGAGSGAGVKVEPIGFLVIKDGNVRMLNIAPTTNTVDRIIDMAPSVIDRVDAFIDKRKN